MARPERKVPTAVDASVGEAAERERQVLRAAAALPFFARTRRQLRLLGPGYLQSAMTLGGGSSTAAIFAVWLGQREIKLKLA